MPAIFIISWAFFILAFVFTALAGYVVKEAPVHAVILWIVCVVLILAGMGSQHQGAVEESHCWIVHGGELQGGKCVKITIEEIE